MVLRSAERGAPVEITRNGQPVAAVIGIAELRRLEEAKKETLSDVVLWLRENFDPRHFEGSDPWEGVRDRSSGRDVDLG